MTSERQKTSILFVLIIILGFIAGSIFIDKLPSWWPAYTFFARFRTHLGLDLQGGTHLLYEADTSRVNADDAASALAGVRDVIERRVNALGISEPLVQTSKVGDKLRVIVELAGVFDVNEAIKQIGETPLLEFKLEATPPPKQELTEEEKKQREEFNLRQLEKTKDIISRLVKEKGANFVELAKEFSEDEGTKGNGGDLGFIFRGQTVPTFEEAAFNQLKDGEMTIEPVQSEFGYHIIQRLESKQDANPQTNNKEEAVHLRHILLQTKSLEGEAPDYDPWQNTGLGGKQLVKSEVQFDNISGVPTVGLSFDDEGAKLFEELTSQNIGKRVAIFLDGAIISAPVVQQAIPGGQAVISGNFTIPEARELVERLNAGALPIPINLISQQTVGPTLGQESLAKSYTAGLAAFALVALFMIILYRLSGFLAVVSLLFYMAITFSLFKLFPVTLSLAGIAGFLLSVGMAVDANVLIFERLKEELRSGSPFGKALADAFSRAWNSIRDSNVSTLISCLLLAWFGTSVIRGFAITLAAGVLVSMLSAVIITRVFMEIASRSKFLQGKKWIWGG